MRVPCSSQDGFVTAETAVVLPVLLVVLCVALSVLGAVTTQLRCLDAAREGARAAARGESTPTVRGTAATVAPAGAAVEVLLGTDLVTVVVRARAVPLPGALRLLLPVTVTGRATAAVEP